MTAAPFLPILYRMIEAVDMQIGCVPAPLRESGLEGKTLVAFVADHGEGLGAH